MGDGCYFSISSQNILLGWRSDGGKIWSSVCHMISSTCINNPCIILSVIWYSWCCIQISTFFCNTRSSDGSFSELHARLSIKISPFRITHNFIASFFGMFNFTTMGTGIWVGLWYFFFELWSSLSCCKYCMIWEYTRLFHCLSLVMIPSYICIIGLEIKWWIFSEYLTSSIIIFRVKSPLTSSPWAHIRTSISWNIPINSL